MHHLLLSRKAAHMLSTAFRYYKIKKSSKSKVQNNPLYNEMLLKKVSIYYLDAELKKYKMRLDDNIQDFRDERIQLKRLKISDGNEQRRNIMFVKGEILDMGQRLNDITSAIIEQKNTLDAQHDMLMMISID
jgi:hypothetical protein